MLFSDLGYYLLICVIWVAVFAAFWAVFGFFIYRSVDRKLRACPNCKKKAAGMIVETEITPLGMQMEHSGKELVQVKSEKVSDQYVCKYCQHTWMRTFERKERIPLGDRE